MSNKIKWLGHSTFLIQTALKNVLLIDIWLNYNPTCSGKVDEIETAEIVLMTSEEMKILGENR